MNQIKINQINPLNASARFTVAVCLGALSLWGCATTADPGNDDRSAKILSMAGKESGEIAAPRERLKRQLNVAEQQIHSDQQENAQQTLSSAADTINGSDQVLDIQTRLAGWVSISELSRNAADIDSANRACDEAVHLLHKIDAPPERCDYVIGVAREIRNLRGKREASKLLVESAAWADQIKDQDQRRKAYSAIAMQLFYCNDYNDGRDVLRHDPDVAWRSDALATLSRDASSDKSPAAIGYGKALDYHSNFTDAAQ